jgi:hypothetical protein
VTIGSGIPFMLTGAMKSALRARGDADVDIENLTPEDAHKILLTPDEHAVRGFLKTFVALAVASLDGHSPPGLVQMCHKHPNDNDVIPARYRLDEAGLVDHLARDAIVASGAGLNVYIEGRLVRQAADRRACGLQKVARRKVRYRRFRRRGERGRGRAARRRPALVDGHLGLWQRQDGNGSISERGRRAYHLHDLLGGRASIRNRSQSRGDWRALAQARRSRLAGLQGLHQYSGNG